MNQNTFQEKFIGEFHTWIAGTQYVRGTIRPGEEVILEREPQNPHDPGAIRLKNRDFEDVGFVPRLHNTWLSKLVDDGKIVLTGFIPQRERGTVPQPGRHTPVYLKIYLAEKGRSLFQPNPSPTTETEALQEAIRILFEKLEGFQTAEAVRGLRRRLGRVLTHDVSPETFLLLNLFDSKAAEMQQQAGKQVRSKVVNYLSNLCLGETLHFRNLTLYPIFNHNGQGVDYLLLKSAIDANQAVVEEVSEQGQVNQLMIHNRCEKPILVPEGEILIGAKQNRVVNITLLVAAFSTLRIPVSCVERGRWRFTSSTFQSAHYAHPKLRGKKLQSVQACRAASGAAFSDQGEVWNEVAENLHELHACSHTDSVTDGYESAEERLHEYRGHFDLPGETTGVLVSINNRIAGLDCFDSSKIFQQCWERLSDSYFMEAVSKIADEQAGSRERADEYLNQIKESIEICDPSIGLGHELAVRRSNFAGSGVWYSNSLCHLSAFSAD